LDDHKNDVEILSHKKKKRILKQITMEINPNFKTQTSIWDHGDRRILKKGKPMDVWFDFCFYSLVFLTSTQAFWEPTL